MTCRLCAWVCDRFCPPEASSSAIWRAAHDWEEDYASHWEPAEEGDEIRNRWEEAKVLLDENPAAALAIHRELAEAGSPFSMLRAGWHYESGRGTDVDAAVAEDFYRRALCAGSWKATVSYARLLFRRGAHDKWPSTLGDGVDKGFIPSFFWLAWYRYERSPSGRTAREVRHLLEAADEAGHPGARLALARWMALGKFGLRGIPRGIRMLRAIFRSLVETESRDEAMPAPASPAPAEEDQTAGSGAAGLKADLIVAKA